MRILRRMLVWLLGLGLTAAALSALAASGAVFHFWIFLKTPGTAEEVSRLTINQGMNARQVAAILHGKGVVRDPRLFYLLCRFHHVPEALPQVMEGRFREFYRWCRQDRCARTLHAGDYAFPPVLTPPQVYEWLREGRVVEHRVTFPEGTTVRDVARIVAQEGLGDRDRVLELARDPDFIASLGLEHPSLEGYLFPETYFFRASHDEEDILKAMARQFDERFPRAWKERARELGFTVHQAVILASLVESEARVDSERPLIAAVFHNRLEKGMLLQSDPTAVYDLPDFSGPITREHLERESPYNTYRKKGLPLGPICNPGSKSLEAVLYPEETSYLYFVSNNDGTHRFSETWNDHVKAVRHYRRKLQEENGG